MGNLRSWNAGFKAGFIAQRCGDCVFVDNNKNRIIPCNTHIDEIGRLMVISNASE